MKKKVTKIQDSEDASLPRGPLRGKSVSTTGWGFCPLLSLAHGLRFRANSRYALPCAQSQHVLSISLEAAPLSEKNREKTAVIDLTLPSSCGLGDIPVVMARPKHCLSKEDHQDATFLFGYFLLLGEKKK